MRNVQYQMPQYNQVSGLMPPISIREFRGLNTFDPLTINDSYFTDMQNMSTENFPALSTRKGYSVLGTFGTRVLGMGAWQNKELHVVFNDGTWRRWNGSAWTTLASGLSTTAEWSFTNFEGNLDQINLIGSNGVNPMKRYNGSTVQDLSGAPSQGKYITTYQNRLWCAVGRELWASALDQPNEWNRFQVDQEDSYRKTIESTHGEDISMLSGSLSKLTIGMPTSLHELYGGIPADFNVKLITEASGVSSNKAITTLEGLMRFIHLSGVYEYAGGVSPDKSFSEIVGSLVTGVTPQACAGNDGTNLYFNIPNDKLLVYDTRPSVQAWTRWSGINAVEFIRIGSDLYIGDSNGRVLRLGGSQDGTNAIPWSVTFKPFNNNSAAQMSRWYKMFLVAEFSGTINIHMSNKVSGEDWTLIDSITSTGLSAQRIIIPVTQFTLENWVRIKLSGTGQIKLHEFTRQTRQLPLY
jgi:hypothetical protein